MAGIAESPTETDEFIEAILDELDTGYDQLQIPVRIWNRSKPLDCFENVRKKIAVNGGSMQVGWLIVKTDIVYETNAHAVWVAPNGKFWYDITPKAGWSSDHIMFVPDDDLKWTGHPIPNRRWNHTGREEVNFYALSLDMYDQIRSLTWYEEGSDQINYPSELVREMERKYEVFNMSFRLFIGMRFPDQAPCPCAAGRPFGECHKLTLRDQIATDKKAIGLV